MKNIGVIVNCRKSRAMEVLKKLFSRSEELGINISADEETRKFSKISNLPIASSLDLDAVDAIVALGGDGTMLRSARELDGRDKPLIGINIGGLGFMTSVSEQDLEKAMECLANDNFEVRERSVAECSVTRNGEKGAPFRALNDAVITGGSSTRVITLDVAIDNDKVTSYVCDGLIVSTPTGSTGHSLSAGGPIVIPESGVFVISLICPHALSSRPLVIPESSRIIIHISDSRDDLKLVADGQISFPLRQDDNVEVVKSKKSIKFIHLPGHSHFSVLRHKLNWSGSSVKQP